MKILYVGLKYDYGNINNGYSFEHLNFYNSLANMKEVKKLDYLAIDEVLKKNGKHYLNHEIINKTKKNGYDLIFFFIFKNEFFTQTLEFLKKDLSTHTVAWMADDHWRFENYSKYWAPFYSYYITTDRDSLLKYKKKNIQNIILSQWGYNHFNQSPKKNPQKNNISFVGMSYGSRFKNIKYLEKKNNLKIDCWGSGWPKGRVEEQKMFNIFKNSLININFTKSSNQVTLKNFIKILFKKENFKFTINTPQEIIDNIKIFIQKDIRQIKARIFEVTGVGGFLLSEKCKYLEHYFETDREIVTFENIEEASEKIDFYRKKEKLINEISINAEKRVLNEHTYEIRFKKIFKTIF